MESLRKTAERVDDAVFKLERLLLFVSLTMMTVLVALDVIQRTFSRPVGKLDSILVALLYGAEPTAEQTAVVTGTVGPVVFAVLSALFFVLGAHSSRSIKAERAGGPVPGFAASAGIGLGVLLGATVFVKGLLWLFPSSVPGAQKFALGFMLWSGMLGASLATRARRHIILDPIKKKLDEPTLRLYSLLGGVVTFGFCAALTVLACVQLGEQFHDWSTGDGTVGVYDALPIPTWVTTLALPLTFGVMALRFLAQGLRDWKWGPPKGGVDAHGVDLDALEKEQLPGAEGGAP